MSDELKLILGTLSRSDNLDAGELVVEQPQLRGAQTVSEAIPVALPVVEVNRDWLVDSLGSSERTGDENS